MRSRLIGAVGLVIGMAAGAQMPPTPPGMITQTRLLSPKGAEQQASLGSPLLSTRSMAVAPAPKLIALPGFVITNFSFTAGVANIGWQNGTPPFQVEGTSDLTNWTPILSTSNRSASFPAGQNHFWRVATVSAPAEVQPFATNIGGPLNDSCNAVARDAQGNLIVAGYFGQSAFAQKRNALGALIWERTASGANPSCVSVDGGGNVFVAGNFLGTATFEGSSVVSRGQYDCFIAKYSSDGELLWVKAFGSSGSDGVTGIAVNGASVVACGFFRGAATVDSFSIDSVNLFMSWVASFDADGQCVWIKPGNPNPVQVSQNFARAVDVDTAGNILLVGYSQPGSLNFGCGSLPFSGSKGYAAKFDAAGSCLWSKNYGDTTRFWTGHFAINGDAIIAGDFQWNTDLGGGTITGTSWSLDAFALRVSGTDGGYSKAAPILGVGQSIINLLGCAVDSSDNFTVVGSEMGTYSSGSQSVSSPGGIQRGFALRFNPSLSAVWGRVFTGTGQSQISGACTAAGTNCYHVGNFSGADSFSGQTLNSNGAVDGCLLLTQ